MKGLRIMPVETGDSSIKKYVYVVDHISKLTESTKRTQEQFDILSREMKRIRKTAPRRGKIMRIYGL